MAANAAFTPPIFLSFVIIINFVMVNFMVTLIMEGFAEVQEELNTKANKYEVVEYFVAKFKGVLGLGAGLKLPPMTHEAERRTQGKY